jgi:hypothetical protein
MLLSSTARAMMEKERGESPLMDKKGERASDGKRKGREPSDG